MGGIPVVRRHYMSQTEVNAVQAHDICDVAALAEERGQPIVGGIVSIYIVTPAQLRPDDSHVDTGRPKKRIDINIVILY